MKIKNKLFAGVGRTDITPILGVQLGGYAADERPAEEIIDSLNSTAIVFEQNSLKTVLISLDWLGIDEVFVEKIRQEINAQTGIKKSNIIITTTHSHTTPITINIPGWGIVATEYIDSVIPKIVDSVVKANDNLKEIEVGVATTTSKTGINRRLQSFMGDVDGIYDPTMTVIRLETSEAPLATIIHYGAHATAFGDKRVVSRDWPGVMMDRVESQTGVPVLFINGSLGDVGPRTNVIIKPLKGFSAGGGDGLDSVREVGYRAATDALRAYIKVKTWEKNSKLDLITEPIEFTYAPLPSLKLATEKMAELEKHKDNPGVNAFNYARWKCVAEAYETKNFSSGKKYNQTIIQLGSIAFVPFPGELFSDISLRLRKESKFRHTLCSSVSNGYYTYIHTRKAIEKQGYEIWMGQSYNGYGWADNIADRLVEQNLNMLNKLKAE
jgi:hypothetical protein